MQFFTGRSLGRVNPMSGQTVRALAQPHKGQRWEDQLRLQTGATKLDTFPRLWHNWFAMCLPVWGHQIEQMQRECEWALEGRSVPDLYLCVWHMNQTPTKPQPLILSFVEATCIREKVPCLNNCNPVWFQETHFQHVMNFIFFFARMSFLRWGWSQVYLVIDRAQITHRRFANPCKCSVWCIFVVRACRCFLSIQ